MKRLQLEQNTDEWLEWRKTKITGSRVSGLIVKRGTEKKTAFWELLAERLSTDTSAVDDPMARGHELERIALKEFTEYTGKEVNPDCGVWVSDVSDYIALSPDGEISETEAVEVKCPANSAYHVKTFITDKVPNEYPHNYMDQVIQYFVVNEKLEQLHFVSYDPRIACKPLHVITVYRDDIKDEIEFQLDYQLKELKEIDALVAKLTF